MDFEEIGINAGNWVDSAQDRNYWRALVNATFNLRVPLATELELGYGREQSFLVFANIYGISGFRFWLVFLKKL